MRVSEVQILLSPPARPVFASSPETRRKFPEQTRYRYPGRRWRDRNSLNAIFIF